MGDSSLLKIISEKLVKPSSPTPPSSRYYKFSHFDSHIQDFLISVAFFFPKGSFHGGKSSRTEIFELLETSLSETLTYYYPFAGRYMDDNITVDCNDAGVQLWKVQIQASMSEILDRFADFNDESVVFPQGMDCYDEESSHVMVQLNHFSCGGICVGICLSHKLGDAQTLTNFVEDWSTIAHAVSRDSTPRLTAQPILSGASVFPASPPPPPRNPSSSEKISSTFSIEKSTYITRRFVFSSSSLSKLKKMVTLDSEIENPSKVEVVTALIFKSAVASSKRIPGSIFKPSSFTHMVNYRSRTNPPLSERYVGNFLTVFHLNAVVEEDEIEKLKLSKLVTEVRKSKIEIEDTFRSTSLEEKDKLIQEISRHWVEATNIFWNKSLEIYKFSSWCRLPFYKVDFGFGKPIFACMTNRLTENTIALMDTPSGDGIEAFITLKKDQMSIFEKDEELLAFATLNPPICIPN